MTMPALTALLLDRDGTLIEDKHYLADPEGVSLLPGVTNALPALARKGVRFFLVSNQSGIGRGFFPAEAAQAVNARLAELLAPYGVVFTDMLFCPHAPEEGCACRKPGTAMWETLKARWQLDPATTLMLGDKEEDLLFAARAGLALRGLVLSGKGAATAQRLGLEGAERTGRFFTAHPTALSHPHLLLPSFGDLQTALSEYYAAGERPCGA